METYRHRTDRRFLLTTVGLNAAIALAALALRFPGLATKDLWLDEALTRELVSQSTGEMWNQILSGEEKNPPLFFLIMHAWVRGFGDSALALRLPPALFGALAVLAAFALGRRVGGTFVGATGAAILAVSPFHVAFSQEARAYPLMVLLTLLSWRFLLDGLSGGRWRDWSLFVVSSLLLTLTHAYGWFVLLAEGLFALARFAARPESRRQARGWLLATALLGVLCVPGALLAFAKAGDVSRDFWIPEPDLLSLARTGLVFSGSRWLLVAFTGLAALAVIRRPRDPRGLEAEAIPLRGLRATSALVLLALWLAVPVLAPFVLSFVTAPIFWPKYAIAASPAWYFLAASGLARVRRSRAALGAATAVLILLSGIELARWYRSPGSEPWSEAVAWLESRANADDLIVFDKWHVKELCWDPHAKRRDLEYLPAVTGKAGRPGVDIRAAAVSAAPVWIVLSHEGEAGRRALESLQVEWAGGLVRAFPGIRVYRFERNEVGEDTTRDRR